jgi:hypothetical protein
MIVALAASRSATAERAQISSRCRKSPANSQRSTRPAAHSSAAPPSANSLNRLNPNHSHHPRHSNPHSPRRATLVPLPRFPPLEVCGRRPPCARRHRHGAGIRKPSQKRKCARSRGMSVRPSGADIVRLHRSGPVRAVRDILHRSTQHLIRSSGRRWHRGPYPRPIAEVSSGSAINITSEVIDHGHRPRPHRRCCSCLIISRASRRDAHLEIL